MKGVGVERIAPLLRVFRAAPTGLAGVGVRERAELERPGLGLIGFHRAAQRSGVGDGTDTVPDLGTFRTRGLSGAVERNIRERTPTHFATLVAEMNTKDPAARVALVGPKRQAGNAADEVQTR